MTPLHTDARHLPSGLYLETLHPAEPSGKPPVLMLHGGAHTGAGYLATLDGRPGWAHDFARAGHVVMLPDWPGVGRSGHVAAERLTGEVVCAGMAEVIAQAGQPVVLLTHSMSGAYGWKLLEMGGDRIAKLVAIAPAQPGNIQAPADVTAETPTTLTIRGTTSFVLDRTAAFVPERAFTARKLAGDGPQFPTEALDRYHASLVAIPPLLIQQRLNVGGSQLRVEDFRHYAGKPVLGVTGDHDGDHPRALDEAIVTWLAAHGARAEYWFLPDRGIVGNGHMMMLERNSAALAAALLAWMGGLA